jgi:hypothetical protein
LEVCKGKFTAGESDMGIPHSNAILATVSSDRDSLIAMEGPQHIGIGDAKVREPRKTIA